MSAPTVNYTRQNCDKALEKLDFECATSISAATTNIRQQNLSMTIGITFIPFLTVPFTIYCIRNSRLYLPIGKALLNFL